MYMLVLLTKDNNGSLSNYSIKLKFVTLVLVKMIVFYHFLSTAVPRLPKAFIRMQSLTAESFQLLKIMLFLFHYFKSLQ